MKRIDWFNLGRRDLLSRHSCLAHRDAGARRARSLIEPVHHGAVAHEGATFADGEAIHILGQVGRGGVIEADRPVILAFKEFDGRSAIVKDLVRLDRGMSGSHSAIHGTVTTKEGLGRDGASSREFRRARWRAGGGDGVDGCTKTAGDDC